jgi:hypothetical protein
LNKIFQMRHYPVLGDRRGAKSGIAGRHTEEPPAVTIFRDEKLGIEALGTTTPDLPPAPNRFASHHRDSEYITMRLGTVSLRRQQVSTFTLVKLPKSSAISLNPASDTIPDKANYLMQCIFISPNGSPARQ